MLKRLSTRFAALEAARPETRTTPAPFRRPGENTHGVIS